MISMDNNSSNRDSYTLDGCIVSLMSKCMCKKNTNVIYISYFGWTICMCYTIRLHIWVSS